MGSLSIAVSGPIYVDTSTIIYSVEAHARYWPVLEPLWQAVRAGRCNILTSELTVMECLVAPLRRNYQAITAAYDQLFAGSELRLMPITRPVLREAARIRAELPAIRTPDALHAATARLSNCAMFLTNDPGFRRVPGLPVNILDDVLTA